MFLFGSLSLPAADPFVRCFLTMVDEDAGVFTVEAANAFVACGARLLRSRARCSSPARRRAASARSMTAQTKPGLPADIHDTDELA